MSDLHSITLKNARRMVVVTQSTSVKYSWQFPSDFPVSIFRNFLHPADTVRNLRVRCDADFSSSEHVHNTCKACFLQKCDPCHVRQHLTHVVVSSVRCDADFSSSEHVHNTCKACFLQMCDPCHVRQHKS